MCKINTKKLFYGISLSLSVLLVALLVYAYGGTNPAVHGHSVQETDLGIVNIDESADMINIEGRMNFSGLVVGPETEGRIILLDSSMTADEIQSKIDEVGKHIPYGTSITFNFTSGTYSLNHSLIFSGFYGGGSILILGATDGHSGGPSGMRCTQSSNLDFSGNSCSGLELFGNDVYIYIHDIRSHVDANYVAINIFRSDFVDVYHSCLSCTSNAGGVGVYFQQNSAGSIYYNLFSGCNVAIYSIYSSDIFAYYNDDYGTAPGYAYYSNTATIRYGANYISPTAHVNYPANGGQIYT